MSDSLLQAGVPPVLRPPAPRDLRVAVAATFAIAGFVTASWAVRIPDISHQVSASHAALGGALLCLSLGALATMRLTGALVDRIGAGLATTLAGVLASVSVVPAGLVGSVTGLGVALMVFGAATGMLNVAMNSLGVRLEAESGRTLLPRLHAAFSFGALGGSLAGGVAAGFAGPGAHLLAVAGAALAGTALVGRALLSGNDAPLPLGRRRRTRPGGSLAGVTPTVVTLGVIAGCTAFAEGALSDWAALHLAVDLQATATVAAAGYAGFSLAMACGRLAGHRLLGWLGETRLLVGGSLLAAAGMLAAALSPDIGVALLGLVVVGLGLANVFPVAIARAGALAGSRGVGLASTVGYGGLLLAPAVVGFVAERAGLPAALTTVSVLAAVAAALAMRLRTISGPRTAAVLPWSYGEALARLRSSLVPVTAALRGAAQRHADSLHLLTPAPTLRQPSLVE